MGKPDGVLKWDPAKIAKALNIDEEAVREYFTDGRRVSFIIERRIARVLNGTLAESEGAGFDLFDSKGDKWEVRSISRSGVFFSPSAMVGSGRKFEEKGFLQKLKKVKGFILSDIDAFPEVPFWIVPSSKVLQWWHDGRLGKNVTISHKTALELLGEFKH
jgi:hypothetical protein